MSRRPLPALLTLVAGATVALATCGASLRRDEFLCEEAHAKLKECCPSFTTHDLDYCIYEVGCGTPGKLPALTDEESNCVRRSTCDRLKLDGVCARAEAIAHRTNDSVAREAVCK